MVVCEILHHKYSNKFNCTNNNSTKKYRPLDNGIVIGIGYFSFVMNGWEKVIMVCRTRRK